GPLMRRFRPPAAGRPGLGMCGGSACRETTKKRGEETTREERSSRKEIEADPHPIPAQRIECGFGSTCLRMRRARAFSSTDAWKQTAKTGAAYSTTAAEGSEKCAASRRAKISSAPRPSPNVRVGSGGAQDPRSWAALPISRAPGASQDQYPNIFDYLS